ncbi:RNA pyrophosphohydrolase [Streptomyces sp. RB5]|uniref:RNA pyrophosphohydrolase n=1 Tax=Streptomyces smaragdinus TaxID=2585196 RepID=A0A7K0CAH0_9ACTN|nr:alpha/beta fold hydrolase [Streptomyces smaragdinus]MQY10450.1 RNA pyrophosphohydrolase [Streptomyces smaragdinus]
MKRFVVEADGERLSGVETGSGGTAAVLMHGAGQSSKDRFTGLLRDLAERGVHALAFDFSGHGDSSGELSRLSLERRFAQARSVIDERIAGDAGLVLVGFSMSGQTVADLTAHYGPRVRSIGLGAPAVYARRAWPLRFGDGFTGVIRTPDSWRDSAALDAYRDFAGRAVLAVPAADAVIPPAVTEEVARALGERSRFTRLVYEDATHHLGQWYRDNPGLRRAFAAALLTGHGSAAVPRRFGADEAAAYYRAHPAPLMTATRIVHDEQGRVLVLTPAYKDHLELPGGLMEAAETPQRTLARELAEELDLTVPVGRLLAVDARPDDGRGRALVAHLHDVGPLTAAQAAAIRFADGEILDAGWYEPADAVRLLPPPLAARLRAALAARAAGSVAHLVGGVVQPGSAAAQDPVVRAGRELRGELDYASYLAGRPKVFAGACVLCTDGDGRVLLVRPAYTDDGRWQLPGGGVEADTGEHPRQAAAREAAEELGLELTPGALLAVDWRRADGMPDTVIHVYDGGVLDAARLAAIRLDPLELTGWRLATPEEARTLVRPTLHARLTAILTARREGGAGALELVDGKPPEGA